LTAAHISSAQGASGEQASFVLESEQHFQAMAGDDGFDDAVIVERAHLARDE